MNTEEIMNLALKLADLKQIPEDSGIYVKGKNIKRILFGIDAGVPELLLAKQLGCDLVIAHHPAGGKAIVDYHEVFKRHIGLLVKAGVPKAEADKAVSRKLEQMEVDGHTRNYDHAVDAAKLLKMPYMNIHTPLDEVGRRTMQEQIDRKTDKKSTVNDVVTALDGLPEFRHATTKIKIRIGKPENPAGKVFVSHGAGTNGGYDVARAYYEHGVGTLIYIHVSPADLERLRADRKGNLIVTGHVVSDSVGINPFLRELENKGIAVTTLGVVPG
jgi:hypothetical protein